jgi:replicative DNA helicase
MFVYREEYYVAAREPKGEGADGKDAEAYAKWVQEMQDAFQKAELIIAKQRHGATGKVRLKFDSSITRFSDYIDEAYLPQRTI